MKKLLLPKLNAAWLLTMMLLMICPGKANAVQGNVTVSQLGTQRVQLDGATTITVDQDWYLREITGGDYDLNIILKNGAQLMVDQDVAKTPAIEAKSLGVSGNGTLYVTGLNIGVWLNGGGLNVVNCNAYFHARHGRDWNILYGVAVEGNISTFYIKNAKVHVSGQMVGIESVNTLYITGNDALLDVYGGEHCIAYQGPMNSSAGVNYFTMEGGEVNLTAKAGTGLQIKEEASITGGKLTINQSGGYWDDSYSQYDHAFSAKTIDASNCEININSSKPAIYNKNCIATFNNAKVKIDVGSGSSGIRVKNLNITGNSDFYVNASHEAISCTGDMSIQADKFFAKSRTKRTRAVLVVGKLTFHMGEGTYEAYTDNMVPFFAAGGIVVDRPYTVNGLHDLSNLYIAQSMTDGFNYGYVFQHNSTNFSSGVKITRPDLLFYTETDQFNHSVSGCLDKGTYTVGEVIHFNAPSIITNFINKPVSNPNATPVITWWRVTKDDNGKPTYVNLNNTSSTYTVKAQDVGHSIYANFGYDTHINHLNTEYATIKKKPRNDTPVKPVLSYRQNYVWVTNNNSSQEYLLLTKFKNVESLTEADWAAAQSSTSTSFRLNATTGQVNYVYTRFKETTTTLPGSVVLYDVVYYGTTDQMKDVVLEFTDITANAPANVIANGWIAVPLNHVIKIEAKPVPGDIIGFQGLKGSEWYLDSKITYYRDAACTQAIHDGEWGHILDADTYYKTLYVKLTRPTLTLGGTSEDRAHYVDITYNNVTKNTNLVTSNADGTYNLLAVEASNGRSPNGGDYEALYVPAGATFEIPMTYYPVNASTDGITFQVGDYYLNNVANTGTPPTLSYYKDNDGQLILSIDATNSEEGLLAVFGAYQNGRGLGTLRIYVTAPEPTGIAINPDEITLEPLFGEAQLQAIFTPSNAKSQTITWSSSDEDVVTVDKNGKVTVGENAIGDEATITATAGDLTATCKVTVTGTRYPIWVNGTQINSLIQEDVFMDGTVSYVGNTLTLNNATLSNNDGGTPALKSEMTNLTIDVVGTNKLSTPTDNALLLRKKAHITGNGELTVTSTHRFGIGLVGYEDVAIDDSVKVSARNTASGAGVMVPNGFLSVNSPEAQLRGYGAYSVGYKSLIGNVTEPANATEVFNDTFECYFVGDATGNIVSKAWVTINGIEEQQQSYPVGDVNGDSKVDVEDVNAVINIILKTKQASDYPGNADVTGDTKVDVEDVNAIINIILKV